jgi:transposase InsO family protein
MVKRVGWDYVRVCVDDATRFAFVELNEDERGEGAAAFLRRAVGEFAVRGVQVERVLTDNGACYRSSSFADACSELAIRHLRTRAYRPRTNGKNRTLHPNARRPMGLRAHLRQLTRTRKRAPALAPFLRMKVKSLDGARLLCESGSGCG